MNIVVENCYSFIVMGVLLLLSGTFSGAETALFSLKNTDINRIRKNSGTINNTLVALHGQLPDFLMTVLFCNMIVNILFFATSTTVASAIQEEYGNFSSVVFGLACLLFVITFGEVSPKTISSVSHVTIARIVSVPMYVLHRLLLPVRIALGCFVRLAERMANILPPSASLGAEELRLLVELSREEGIINSSEHEMMTEVMELPMIKMSEVMTPRVDVVTVDSRCAVDDAISLAREHGHAKIPVRDLESDEFVGWVDARELFVKEAQGDVAGHMTPFECVSVYDRADNVLKQFVSDELKIALVVDEWGGCAGIVTMWDISREIFGDIGDEEIRPEDLVSVAGENLYRLSGRLSVREWRTLFGIASKLPRATTVAGLVTALLGHAPNKGDSVRLGNLMMTVESTRKRKIVSILLELVGVPLFDKEENTV